MRVHIALFNAEEIEAGIEIAFFHIWTAGDSSPLSFLLGSSALEVFWFAILTPATNWRESQKRQIPEMKAVMNPRSPNLCIKVSASISAA